MIIYTVLIVIIGIVGVLMATVILLQSGKGGGLAGIAGGGTTQLLGGRQAPDVLEKATWVLATIFISLAIVTNFFVDTAEKRQSIIQSQSQQAPIQVPAGDQPAGEGDAPTTPDQ